MFCSQRDSTRRVTVFPFVKVDEAYPTLILHSARRRQPRASRPGDDGMWAVDVGSDLTPPGQDPQGQRILPPACGHGAGVGLGAWRAARSAAARAQGRSGGEL